MFIAMLKVIVCSLFVSQSIAITKALDMIDLPFTNLYTMPSRAEMILKNSKKHQIEHREEVYDAYYCLLPLLRKNNVSLKLWFNEANIDIIIQELKPHERVSFARALQNISKFIEAGLKDEKYIILNSVPTKILSRVNKIQHEIDSLKLQHKNIIALAQAKHEVEFKHQYDGLGYSVHLREVRAVLKRFGIGPKDSMLGLVLGSAAWLHDIIEDTDLTYEDLQRDFNQLIALIVRGVSKVEKTEGMSSQERLRITYKLTTQHEGSRILKLADRIANVEKGLKLLLSGYPSKVSKYFQEWDLFYQSLYNPDDSPEMWAHLDRLLTDKVYAEKYIRMLLKYEHTDIICMNVFLKN
ncbi:MAG: bifunctional (p)ppGpp synthetase/guanosine-3',5'-bis(diphosphate) 3'-pyrophosphohydrolase [Halobacteriovoraceae bacterium]|nr:bifunctional (p)ppGpp synthetase/guanosine-3',5'-bis(diphosphate) 3'-pyrophosphohydrolase [Halobacteriovoraceae bacterium]